MSTFNDIVESTVSQWNAPGGYRIVPFLISKPGGGKSACAKQIGVEMGIPDNRIVQFFVSLRDPVDLLGTPHKVNGETLWAPPQEIAQLATGRWLLILEELPDGSIPMQNAACGLLYDRRIGSVTLSNECFIIATGNRTEDKSGANRVTTKLANRVRRWEYVESLKDWEQWAHKAGIDPVLIQFMRYRPALLSDFDPNRFCNPTPRAWERVSLIPTDMRPELYALNVFGEVGEGAGAEYVAFRRVYDELTEWSDILAHPTTARVPEKIDALYATAGMVAKCTTTPELFDKVYPYIDRLGVLILLSCVLTTSRLSAPRSTPSPNRLWTSRSSIRRSSSLASDLPMSNKPKEKHERTQAVRESHAGQADHPSTQAAQS